MNPFIDRIVTQEAPTRSAVGSRDAPRTGSGLESSELCEDDLDVAPSSGSSDAPDQNENVIHDETRLHFPHLQVPELLFATESAPRTVQVPKIAGKTILGVIGSASVKVAHATNHETTHSVENVSVCATAENFICGADPRLVPTEDTSTPPSPSAQPSQENGTRSAQQDAGQKFVDTVPLESSSPTAVIRRGHLMCHSLVLSDAPVCQGSSVARTPGQQTDALPCHVVLPASPLPKVRIDPVTLLPKTRPSKDSSGGDNPAQYQLAGIFGPCSVPDWSTRCVQNLRRAEGAIVGDLAQYAQSVTFKNNISIASRRAAAELVDETASLSRPAFLAPVDDGTLPTASGTMLRPQQKLEFVVKSDYHSKVQHRPVYFQVSKWADHNQ